MRITRYGLREVLPTPEQQEVAKLKEMLTELEKKVTETQPPGQAKKQEKPKPKG